MERHGRSWAWLGQRRRESAQHQKESSFLIHLPHQSETRAAFTIGRHSFPASDVCASGRFTARGIWKGPPRGDLKPRFERWAEHLCAGIDLSAAAKGEDVAGAKAVHYAEVQTQGGYQNLFIVGERAETTDALWARVRESEFRS